MPFDPQSLAIVLAALAGGALGLAGLLVARNRRLERALHALRTHAEELADRNWELRDSQERARGLNSFCVISRTVSTNRRWSSERLSCTLVPRFRSS